MFGDEAAVRPACSKHLTAKDHVWNNAAICFALQNV
jgi:hypothetical protein